jgi:4-diphosphocytidyl-2-C-methyl-D-erythritol kinase
VLPTGAGLGGGSSDGAHVLRALNEVFDLRLSRETLLSFAADLGSDCGFFLFDEPMLGTGRGEILSPVAVSLKGYFLVLIKPAIHVSTAEAYAGVVPKRSAHVLKDVLQAPVGQWRELLVNHFEKSVFEKYPAIEVIKRELYKRGALYAAMSGSGAAVFGIFDAPVALESHFVGAIYWAGELTI